MCCFLCLRSYLGLDFPLCVRLVYPAVEVRGHKQGLLLLQRQPLPPALLQLLEFDSHLTLSDLTFHLKTGLENDMTQAASGQRYCQILRINVSLF